ncbi:nidogen-like domain-containing protein [Bradyrhizobium cenepequi]|uniref:nidogen-like domain-containing protein n=1 Tax=Bradyrhizobium cenepequi TaxID=2821403 RepID=UPI001CE2764E|nr:nidogen-like domain-containing protein [Bradyrhizobium cenepequi]MCA6109249.1 cadherin-like domain-containing protein [Bradyrhizobium cenepequi]
MNYAGKFGSSGLDSLSNAHVDLDSFSFRADHADSFIVPDAHLLFSGNFNKSGDDLVISDELHRVVVPNYFHGDKHPMLLSPEGASLDPKVVDALTGHTVYAQAGAPPAANLVGHIAKMTGSASVVRGGVTVELHNSEAVYQNDVVQTGSGSTLGLVLNDGTTFNLNANARLMLNELTYDASSSSNSSLITLVQGAASFVAGQVARTGDMKVATPIATMGIRGTAVILDISSVDGTVKISVIDQQDNQVHAVQVFNTRGVLIGTVTSNGSILTLTPAAAFELIARESAKTLAEIAQEFATFQAVLNTYDIRKAIDPNLPQHTENDANPRTRYASYGSSTGADSPGTEFISAFGSGSIDTNGTGSKTFIVKIGNLGTEGSTSFLQDSGVPPSPQQQPQPQINGSAAGSVIEDQATIVAGTLAVQNVNSAQIFQPVPSSALAGSYGNFTFDANTGAWTYTLVHEVANQLAEGQVVHDTLTVTSADGTQQVIDVTVTGSNDMPMVASGTVADRTIEVLASTSGNDRVSPELAAQLDAPGLIGNLPGGSGYGALALAAGDDNSSVAINVTPVFGAQGINFFGHYYTSLYINNNGNITFGSPTDTYTPSVIDGGLFNPIIAVFWADVDTRGGGAVYYDLDEVNGVMTITWDHVGYYSYGADRLNSFQLVLIDQGNGNFDIQYRYGDIQWTTGEASGGSGGLGGIPARVGYSAGDGMHYYELLQSGNQSALLELGETDGNTGIDGVDQFEVRNGDVVPSSLTTTGTINFSDPDLTDTHNVLSVTYVGSDQPLGTLTLVKQADTTGTGTGGQFVWTYTADPADVRAALGGLPNHSKVETFNVVISDGHGGTFTQTVSVTLNEPDNHAPVVSGAVTGSATEDGASSILDTLANASDVDQNALTVVDVPTQLPPGVSYDANSHAFTLDPSASAYQYLADGQHTTVTVHYGVSDGTLVTPASASWTITGANDAPVAVPVVLANGTKDASYIICASDLIAGVSDIDSQLLSITGLSIASGGGCLVDNQNGTWTYTPVPGHAGPVSFTYTASDGALSANSTATLTLDCDSAPITPVAATVHSPDGYDFTTFYDDLVASQFANVDETGSRAFVVNFEKGITFEMVGSGYSYDPETGSISNVINEIDIFGTTDPTQATAANLLVSTLGWNINVQAIVNPDQDPPSDPVVPSTGLGAFDFGAVSFNYVGSTGRDVFLPSNHPDVFNGLGGPLGPTDPGCDTVNYSSASGPISVDLLTGATAGAAAAGDLFFSIENLRGTAFSDTLAGDGHNNVLFGGAGNDAFVFKQTPDGIGHDTIGDFAPGQDKIALDYVAFDPNSQESFNAWFQDHVSVAQNSNDVLIDLDGNNHNTILLKNLELANLHANDFIFPPGSV